ncbi:hypothetical protein J6590_066468 [Homalodisca vitripennis]|nr:hypothetical protein J6590_066468 [Homalodisca vitripennis]
MTEIHLQTDDGKIRILFAAVYLPYDSQEQSPAVEMRRIVVFGTLTRRHLVISYDANPPHCLGEQQHQQSGSNRPQKPVKGPIAVGVFGDNGRHERHTDRCHGSSAKPPTP